MRRVVVYELVSLDGVAEAPDQFMDWYDEMDAALGQVIAPQDAVILGRRSYDDWSAYWPGKDIQPFSDFINPVAKYVATSTPLDREWTNATVIDGDLVSFVRELKGGQGGQIGIHASISVARALLAAGVVDELKLMIAPKVVGHGRRLFEGIPPIDLEPIRWAMLAGGNMLVEYRVVG